MAGTQTKTIPREDSRIEDRAVGAQYLLFGVLGLVYVKRNECGCGCYDRQGRGEGGLPSEVRDMVECHRICDLTSDSTPDSQDTEGEHYASVRFFLTSICNFRMTARGARARNQSMTTENAAL